LRKELKKEKWKRIHLNDNFLEYISRIK
jgi:hypothetical protein